MDEIILQQIPDAARGNLFIGEVQKHIPFPIKRFYFVTDISHKQVVRGGHAHKTLEQAMFCIRGSCTVRFDDGKRRWETKLSVPEKGVRVRPLVWHDFTDCSSDCVVFVVASESYNAADYIYER